MVSCVSAFSHLATLCQLAARKGDHQALDAWLSTMQVQATTAVSLVSSLIVLAESDQPLASAKRVSLSRCAFAALEELAHTRGPISSRVTVDALPDVLGDECLLTRVFVNLIGNALKFSARAAEPRVMVASIPNGEGPVRICVSDNGSGFPPALAEELFTPFFRAHDSSFVGHGIGLSLVRSIIDRHDGKVWAESTPGKGACVWFTLPPV